MDRQFLSRVGTASLVMSLFLVLGCSGQDVVDGFGEEGRAEVGVPSSDLGASRSKPPISVRPPVATRRATAPRATVRSPPVHMDQSVSTRRPACQTANPPNSRPIQVTPIVGSPGHVDGTVRAKSATSALLNTNVCQSARPLRASQMLSARDSSSSEQSAAKKSRNTMLLHLSG